MLAKQMQAIKKKKGIDGKTSTIGLKSTKASGSLETSIVVIISII